MRRSVAFALAFAFLLASGCGLFFRPEPARSPGGGAEVSIAIGGLLATGAPASKGISADSNVAEVIVTAYNASSAQVGRGSMTKGVSSWQGTISLSETGQLRFVAVAGSSDHVPLYRGVETCVIETGSEDVVIGVSKAIAGEWLFGGNANDTSGNGANGTIYGNPALSFDRFNGVEKAYTFDGDGDYIKAAAGALPSGERTVSLWFYANSLGPGAGLMGYGGDGSNGTSYWEDLKLGGTSRYTVGSHDPGISLYGTYASEPLSRWVHWVTTTSSSGTKIYIDGIELASGPTSFSTITAGAFLFLGCIGAADGANPLVDSSNTCFHGRLDEIRVYDYALSSTEIGYLYHEKGYDPRGGLVGEWLFGGDANDTSGFGNNGTATNGASLAADRFDAANSAYTFDGSNDYIDVPGFAGTYSTFTVSFWRKSPGASTCSGFYPRVLQLEPNTVFEHSGLDQLTMNSYVNNNNKGSVALSQNAWHHVLLKCDGSAIYLYVDGSLANTASASSFTVATLMIGGGSYSRYFYGLVDDVRIWNRAVSSTEIEALYHEGDWNLPKAEPSLYPSSFAAGTASKVSIPLTWTDATGTVAPDGYLVKWSDVSYAAIIEPVDGTAVADGAGSKNAAQGAQTCTAAGLASGTTYYFKIWPYTNLGSDINYKQGTAPESSAATSPSEPSEHPGSFACGTTTAGNVPLSWTDATGAVPAEYYLIKWSTVNYEAIADPTDGTSVPDGASAKNVAQGLHSTTITGLSASTTYYFKIWPYTSSGSQIDYKLGSEPQASATTASPKAEPSGYPSSFATTASGSMAFKLTWTDYSGSVDPDAYLVKISASTPAAPADGTPEADGATVKNVAQGVQTCVFTGLAPSALYYFKIWPYSDSGVNIDYKTDGTPPETSGTTAAIGAVLKTSDSSWTVPANVYYIKVCAVGGGGGGGGAGGADATSGGSGGAGGMVYRSFAVSPSQSVDYSLGTGGTGGYGAANGTAGGNTTCTVGGVTITAGGGSGGYYNSSSIPNGGTYSGGDGGAAGGKGGGASGDTGGNGGGAIGAVDANASSTNAGYAGKQSVDVSGLFAAAAAAGSSTTSPGAAGGLGTTSNANHGGNASGFGCGGGGAGWYGGNGGAGLYGGGGGGAAGVNTQYNTGGVGGQGVVVIQY